MAENTAVRKYVHVVSTASSKAEEWQTLMEMAACAERGSYLESLFSGELLNWVKDQMANDFPCDIMDHLRHASDEVQEAQRLQAKAEAAVKHYEGTIKDLEGSLARREELMNNQTALIRQRNDEIGDLTQQLLSKDGDYNRLAELAEDAQNALKDEIIRLKAEIYDLEHKAA